MRKEFFNKIKTLFEGVSDDVELFLDVKTEDGRVFRVDGEEIKLDVSVKEIVEPAEGDESGDSGIVDIEDGVYKLDDGRSIKLEAGIIVEIIEAEEDEVSTDSGDSAPSSEELNKVIVLNKMSYDDVKMSIVKETWTYEYEVTNVDFKVGDVLEITYVEDGENINYDASAGTYELEDGRLITTDSSGVILVIVDAEGNVLEAPVVGDNVEDVSGDEDMLSAFGLIKNELDSIKEEYKKLENKYNELAKSPSAKFEKTTGSFKKEVNGNSRNSNSPIRKMFGYN